MKNIKIVAGFTLLVQSVACMVLSICFWKKKNSLAKVLAGVSAAGGVAGVFLVATGYKEECESGKFDCFDDCCECDDEYFDGDDFDSDDVICNFEDTDLYDEDESPEENEI